MPYPGEIIGGVYQIADEIGRGGIGIIYRAYHLNLQKYVVVKKIKDNFQGALEARAEVDILKSLHHSCLPQVYDFLQIGTEVYTVMDYIDGHDLQYYIDRGYRFEEETLWSWIQQLCEVLDYLHKHGILHLDIKPANIMLSSEGNIYLIDFNISLSGQDEELIGISQHYAAPEQYRKWLAILYGNSEGDTLLDERTDIYSLGAVFYHMMTGVKPTVEISQMIPIENYRLDYSENLVSLISWMMTPEKEKRCKNAGKLLGTIQRLRRTAAEKRTLNVVFYGMLTGILILLAVTGILFFRSRFFVSSSDRVLIADQEKRMQTLYDGGDYKTAYEEGLQFLNEKSNELRKLKGAEQVFLEILANCSLEMGDYGNALDFAEHLLDLEENFRYYSIAAIASAYSGDFETAEIYLQKSQQLKGNPVLLGKIQAEMKAAQGDIIGAIRAYQNLSGQGDENAILRRVGVLSLKAADVEISYIQTAIDSYRKLIDRQEASYVDRMNLVSAYLMCGMNEKAAYVLQEMIVLYPEDIEVFKRLAVLKYKQELKKAPSERRFIKVREYAEKAIELYDKSKSSDADEQIEDLRRLLKELP